MILAPTVMQIFLTVSLGVVTVMQICMTGTYLSYLIGADIMEPGDRPRLGTALVLGPFLWPLVTCLCLVPKQSSPVGSGRHINPLKTSERPTYSNFDTAKKGLNNSYTTII